MRNKIHGYNRVIQGPFTVSVYPDPRGSGWSWTVFVPDVMNCGMGFAHSKREGIRQGRRRVKDCRKGSYTEIHPT